MTNKKYTLSRLLYNGSLICVDDDGRPVYEGMTLYEVTTDFKIFKQKCPSVGLGILKNIFNSKFYINNLTADNYRRKS
jgi:hypothetical protein